MRIWSLHPKYLDARGLVALWREALLAQAVLRGKTRGYRHHPQLLRFRAHASPVGGIGEYLRAVHEEAATRGYSFAAKRITRARARGRLTVTRGQLEFEWRHLLEKLSTRDPERLTELSGIKHPRPHALFRVVAAAILLALACAGVRAEPYLAVQTGLRCAQCHVNQTGGGMRTPFGNQFAQTQLAANRLPGAAATWLGQIGSSFGIGANLRAAATRNDVAGSRQSDSLDLREARVYLSFTPIADRLSFYVDQYLGPGSSQNREAFVRYSAADGSTYLKAGRFYLPFGWRLQDNSTFVRSQTAIDMAGPDLGVELGWDRGPLSLQFAVSNGTFGESEVDSGKQ